MKCPNCKADLEKKTYRGIEVDKCNACGGMWLDLEELDQLEDEVYKEDDLKGSLMFKSEPTERICPKCGSELDEFRYRINDLRLDYCKSQHGFWLDEGEAEQVLQLMREREKNMDRTMEAEAQWDRTLLRFRSKSFWTKLTDLFK